MTSSGPGPLIARWRSDAEVLRRRGAPALAEALESAADEAETWWREWRLELLTLQEAAGETGLAYDTAQRKVASGEWPNRGSKGRPRVYRADVQPGLTLPPEPRGPDDPVDALAHP